MCGIIAVVRRPSTRAVPSAEAVRSLVELGLDALVAAVDGTRAIDDGVTDAAGALHDADLLLRGVAGVTVLLADRGLLIRLDQLTAVIEDAIADIEAVLDADTSIDADRLEVLNAEMVRLKDAAWAVRHDRLRTARAVEDLAGPDAGPAAIAAYLSIQQALSALDRLEVRGRDSAGLQVLVRDHHLDLDGSDLRPVVEQRGSDPLLTSMSVRRPNGSLSFVYKASAEIGELGDNTRELRTAIRADSLLRLALEGERAQALVLGHTRWASVGIISQANAHPLDSDEVKVDSDEVKVDSHGVKVDPEVVPYVTAVLNGDVDNFADLKATEGLAIAAEITTDAKVIPTLTSRRLAAGDELDEAFRSTVTELEGSVAIAASAASHPDDLLLALRGSGQALYVGLAEDAYIVASEPYGVVEEARSYLRMDGETTNDPDNPASRGQILHLRGSAAGDVAGIDRWSYDGVAHPVDRDELATAPITTRDIDRGEYPHFLLKEISEAPASVRKTLRGKLVEVDGTLRVRLPSEAFPLDIGTRLADRSIRRVLVIGQGTAAVAGQSLAAALRAVAPDAIEVLPVLATELSGFSLQSDMSDTLVVAISQSGTTTDTNRTVDLVRGRGAAVIAIVNRRGSDLTDKSDGVLYTSDGRDVEMSVASTKAFYAQIAASFLLAIAIADELGVEPPPDRADLLASLRELPEVMQATLAKRPELADAARRLAPSRRYWAIVGNGANRIAAEEIRIKLSELCYKAIACDSTEDKKHIDLSSEPMILVCAAGLSGSTADDVAKEVAIYRAHKAAPIVIASEGDERFSAALQAVLVPATHPALAFVLCAVAGHLFGYEAALAIDAQAKPLRSARAAVEEAISTTSATSLVGGHLLDGLRPALTPLATRFFDELRGGQLDGHLEASSAVRLASMFRYALGVTPLDAYQIEFGKVGTPSVVIEDFVAALTGAIEELTRPVDAIKHQAKTVTVGISRSDETLLQVPLVRAVIDAGAGRDRLSYQTLRTLGALEPVVAEVLGYTRYVIEGSVDDDEATIVVTDRGGLGRELRSRTDTNPALRGTKRLVAGERQVVLAQGRSDGRTVLLVPLVKDAQTTGLVLLHVGLAEALPLATLRSVLGGYRGRYQALKDIVTETEPTFRDDVLTTIPLVELMTDPISELADRWRT